MKAPEKPASAKHRVPDAVAAGKFSKQSEVARRSAKNGSEDGHPEGYSVDNQVGFLLRIAHQGHNANLAARLSPFELTPPQAVVLARLLERDHVSQNLLGRLVAMEPANIRDVALRLKKRGLVHQQKDKDDGRLLLLSLTAEGRTMARKLIPLAVKSVADTLHALNAGERDMLRDLLKRVVASELTGSTRSPTTG